MTEVEKLEARIESLDAAIAATKTAMGVDRKMSHDKHPSGHFTKALAELMTMQSNLKLLKIRVETVGR
jgi:hypothetical protein